MRFIVTVLAAQLAWSTLAADLDSDKVLHTRSNSIPRELVPGPDDGTITTVTARLLERAHYLRQPLTNQVGSKFLDRYIDSLDNLHLYFTQADLQQFEKYRNRLASMTLKGDTSLSRIIFEKFLQRIEQQYEFVTNQLQTARFDFSGNDRFLLNRRTAPRPKDTAEAKALWMERLRYEYLQEKLNIGRPDTIAKVVQEKLEQGQAGQVKKALQEKVSKEKAESIAKVVESNKGEKPETVARLVLEKLNRENGQEIINTIVRRYTRVLRFLKEYDNDDVMQVYLTALAHVYDPHSDYMGHAELENFAISMKLSLFGIGALLRSEDGICRIHELKPGPAQKSGKLKPNDKIVAVAQGDQEAVDVVDMPLKKVVELIRGPKGTEVRLTVVPGDAPDPSVRKVITLVRDEIKLEDQEAKAKVYDIPTEGGGTVRLGYIDLPSFYANFDLESRKTQGEPKSTTTDVAKLLSKLKQEHVAGVVLDLRRNGGGSLEEAISLTGLFISEGPVVQVRGSDSTDLKVYNDPDPTTLYEGPLVVLTSRFSASASEILTGALQDYGRALIVGDSSTHGKGTVQSLLQLAPILRGQMWKSTNDPGALKITIRKFYRPSGSSTQLRGVVPDIVLPSLNNALEVGEASLENPLDWDTIEAAEFKPTGGIDPFLGDLRKRSNARLTTNSDFAFIRGEVDRYKKALADKTVSLNEAQRLKEKQELEARDKARKKELAARAPSNETVYELKLQDIALPGLPAPQKKTNLVASITESTSSPHATGALTAADPNSDSEAEEGVAEDKTPTVDPTLDETKRILLDLVNLSNKAHALAVTRPPETKSVPRGQQRIPEPANLSPQPVTR